MRKIIIGLFFLLLTMPFYSQNQQDNLNKYWNYRNRLKSKFMVVSPNVMDFGVNIPAAEIFYNNPSDPSKNRISWGDANSNMSQYLSVLATELWILKNNGQNYSTSLNELFYAMLALERLDNYSESNLRWKAIINPQDSKLIDSWTRSYNYINGDINGFSLRDDVSPDFWRNYSDHFDVGNCSGHLNSSTVNGDCVFIEENSQDVIEHDLFGLGIISKLLGVESVGTVPCDDIDIYIKSYLINRGIMTLDSYTYPKTVDFSLWAKNIVKRYINYMQSYGTWHSGVLSTNWVLVNPVTNQSVAQGNGEDFGVSAISPGIIMAGQAITGENLRNTGSESLISDDDFRTVFQFPTSWYSKVCNLIGINIDYEDDLIRTVSCLGNALGNQTFSMLRDLRDNYNPHNATSTTIYEHLPLINLVMFDPNYQVMGVEDNVYNTDKSIYEGLLNSAPVSGPIKGGTLYNNVRDWSSTSRCLWPQHNVDEQSHPDQMVGEQPSSESSYIAFNGLDYMLLHNLYYIAFRKEDINTMKISNIAENNVDVVSSSILNIARRTNSQRAGTIEAGCSILGNDVTYNGLKQVKLVNGFSSTSFGGKKFAARVNTHRPNNYDGSAYVVPEGYSSAPAFVRKSHVKDVSNLETTLIENQSTVENITILPNPCRDKLAISINNFDVPVAYCITSTNGVVVNSDKITSNHHIIDLSVLPKGVYFISLYLKDKTETKKIILI